MINDLFSFLTGVCKFKIDMQQIQEGSVLKRSDNPITKSSSVNKRKIPILSKDTSIEIDQVPNDDTEEASIVAISADSLHPETTRQRILKMVASLHGEQQKSITTSTIPVTAIPSKHIQDDGIEAEEDIIGTKELREHEEESLKKRIDRSRQKTQDIMASMDKDALKRYETFRRSGLHRNLVKRWLQNYLGITSIHQNIVIMCAGVAKVFVGELIERACLIRDTWEGSNASSTPLTPSHIEEAYRQLHYLPGNVRYDRLHVLKSKKHWH